MSNIITRRRLRSARILAGLTQKQLAQAVGFHERAPRYWELKEDRAPTSTPSSLEKIEAVSGPKFGRFVTGRAGSKQRAVL